MTWTPLLLADPSPCLRWLVLRELDNQPGDNQEVAELDRMRRQDPLVTGVVDNPSGGIRLLGKDQPDHHLVSSIVMTSQTLLRLGYLGFGRDEPLVARGAAYLFEQQQADGSWPMPEGRTESEEHEGYSMMPLQTALPLRGLAACGYACDDRAERAYDWLLDQRLPDGAWPTGRSSGVYGFVAGYRRLAHSRWGCRSNTTGALCCLAQHPQRRAAAETRRALDLLLGRETHEREPLGFETARILGAEPVQGFITYYARFDLALILDLCWRIGASLQDERVSSLVEQVQIWQGAYGLWTYPSKPQMSRWVSFDLLRSLAHLGENDPWQSTEPRTAFQPYLKKRKRY